jgi:hypothetical protein
VRTSLVVIFLVRIEQMAEMPFAEHPLCSYHRKHTTGHQGENSSPWGLLTRPAAAFSRSPSVFCSITNRGEAAPSNAPGKKVTPRHFRQVD